MKKESDDNRFAMYEQALANEDYEAAINHARRASVLNPADVQIHLNLGQILGEWGHTQEAMDELWIAHAMQPE